MAPFYMGNGQIRRHIGDANWAGENKEILCCLVAILINDIICSKLTSMVKHNSYFYPKMYNLHIRYTKYASTPLRHCNGVVMSDDSREERPKAISPSTH